MVTQHAQARIRKRAGIPRSGANRLARKAYLHGITHSQTRGKLRAYCDRLYFQQRATMRGKELPEKLWKALTT